MVLVTLLVACTLLSACQDDLYAKLPEADANEILDALYSAGVSAAKQSADGKTWSISVDSADLQRALRVTRESGLPRQQFASTGELFRKEGLVSTPSEERIRYIFAVSQELAHTLSQIDGVVSARVHPVIPENDPLVDKVRAASASVFIKHRRSANLEAMAPAIKNLVMRGIEGLSYDNISLTFVAADAPVAGAAPAFAAPVRERWPFVAIGVLAFLLTASLSALAWVWTRARRADPPSRGIASTTRSANASPFVSRIDQRAR